MNPVGTLRGKCNFGATCKYEHRCSYCFKFGHSVLNCRKAASDRNSRNRGEQKTAGNQSFTKDAPPPYGNSPGGAATNEAK